MKVHKYALGLWEMLSLAIHEHYMKHQGLLPRRFEMHPANLAELLSDERIKYMNVDKNKLEFMGVPIVVDVKADRLKMITTGNTVEYL